MPLHGIRVLDFSTLLPGPLASLILAEAGAEVIKVERPGRGEDMRGFPPLLDGTGGGFAMLNRGKKSVAVDLHAEGGAASLLALARDIDVVIEQFRPGVMARLGVGYEAWRAANSRIIYCAITGYGQSGPRAQAAGHDLNYAAETGLLSFAAGTDGRPGMPPALIADIGGGAYPAVINILLALRQRDATGEGCFLDIAMTDNLFTFAFWGLAMGFGTAQWPKPGAEQLTGGSPRYRIYRTADAGYLALGALEEKFWQAFCAIAGVPDALRDDARDAAATTAAVSDAIAARPASDWAEALNGVDACASIVRTLEEAVRDLHFRARGLFDREVTLPGHVLPALPVPLASALRRGARSAAAPAVEQDTEAILQRTSP